MRRPAEAGKELALHSRALERSAALGQREEALPERAVDDMALRTGCMLTLPCEQIFRSHTRTLAARCGRSDCSGPLLHSCQRVDLVNGVTACIAADTDSLYTVEPIIGPGPHRKEDLDARLPRAVGRGGPPPDLHEYYDAIIGLRRDVGIE